MFQPLSLKVQNKYFLGETMKSNVEQVLCQVVSLRVDERSHDDFVSFFFSEKVSKICSIVLFRGSLPLLKEKQRKFC